MSAHALGNPLCKEQRNKSLAKGGLPDRSVNCPQVKWVKVMVNTQRPDGGNIPKMFLSGFSFRHSRLVTSTTLDKSS